VSPCQILYRSVKPLRRYGRIRFFKMAAVRHFDFQKLKNVTAHTLRRAKVRHHANVYADQSNSFGDMAVF